MNELAVESAPVAVAPDEAPRRKPGNPNWVKKADVINENKPITDRWFVRGKDPDKHYVWGRKDSEEEMNEFAQRGYVPAKGREKVMGNPFEATADTDGQTKIRGNRILMCCPKELVKAREDERARRYISPKKAAEADARRMNIHKGVSVQAISDDE